jgi:hypothetical protein
VLVFFDDILIYGTTWAEHLQHIRLALLILRWHKLAIKQNKCSFGASSISYLSHIIFDTGVAMDPTKVKAVQAWSCPMDPTKVKVVHKLSACLSESNLLFWCDHRYEDDKQN